MGQILKRSLRTMRLLRVRAAKRVEARRRPTPAERILTRYRTTFEILARK